MMEFKEDGIKYTTHELDHSIKGLVYCSCKKYPIEPTLLIETSIEFKNPQELFEFLKKLGNSELDNSNDNEYDWEVSLKRVKTEVKEAKKDGSD